MGIHDQPRLLPPCIGMFNHTSLYMSIHDQQSPLPPCVAVHNHTLLPDCMFIRKMLQSDWLDYGMWTIYTHFRIDGQDHLYGFRSKLKHRIIGKMVEKLSTEVVKSLLRSENCR